MKFNKKLGTLVGTLALNAFVFSNAGASGVMFRVPLTEQLSTWKEAESIYHKWINVGQHYGCEDWNPDQSEIDYGKSYIQSRDCSQDQKREVELREKDSFSNLEKTVDTKVDERTIKETEKKDSLGTHREWHDISNAYGQWSNYGNRYSYSRWSPKIARQMSSFKQERSYSQEQRRTSQPREKDSITGDIRNSGSESTEKKVISGKEYRNIAFSKSAWSNNGSPSYTEWAPGTGDTCSESEMTQTRTKTQPQTRTRYYKYGSLTLGSPKDSRDVSSTETRSVSGTKNCWSSASSTYSSWKTRSTYYGYGGWSPRVSSQISNFTQKISFIYDQTRTRQARVYNSTTGKYKNSGSPVTEKRTRSGSQSRTISVSVSSWSNRGSGYNYGTWTPSTRTVRKGSSFTQTRSYSQKQVRTWRYKAGSSSVGSRTESRVVSKSASQGAVGTKTSSRPIDDGCRGPTRSDDHVSYCK